MLIIKLLVSTLLSAVVHASVLRIFPKCSRNIATMATITTIAEPYSKPGMFDASNKQRCLVSQYHAAKPLNVDDMHNK